MLPLTKVANFWALRSTFSVAHRTAICIPEIHGCYRQAGVIYAGELNKSKGFTGYILYHPSDVMGIVTDDNPHTVFAKYYIFVCYLFLCIISFF